MAPHSSVQKYPTGGAGGVKPPAADGRPKAFFARNPSALIFIACLAVFTLLVTVASEANGAGFVSTSFVKTLGKTLCLCLVALAMDLIWGYAGILSLGHMAFFALGGYMTGMWLMYARTEEIVVAALSQGGLPATPEEISQGIATQIFGVVGASDLPAIWGFAHSLPPAADPGAGRTRPSGPDLRLAGLPLPRYRRLSVDPDAGDDPRAGAVPVSER